MELNQRLLKNETLGDKTMTRDNALLYGLTEVPGTQREAFKWKIQQALLSLGYWTSFFQTDPGSKGVLRI